MIGVTKINQLLQEIPAGTVLLSPWLVTKGYPYSLQQRYRKNGWLTSIGKGAMIRVGDKLTLEGALYSIQAYGAMDIHIGGRTALGMHGLAHYLELSPKETILVAPRGMKLPAWFDRYSWDTRPILIHTSFLPSDLGLTDFMVSGFSVRISNPVRALMECLILAPDQFDLVEAYQLMEGLSFVNPNIVQSLLAQCQSVKVTRLFLFLASKAGHVWFSKIQTKNLNLGQGKRVIERNGVFDPRYQITVPKVLMA
jgi:hypothetical protein